MDPLAQRLAVNLRRCRQRAGMSLGETASAAGLGKSTLHALEQGSGNPTLSTVWALASALAVPLGELLDEKSTAVTVVRAAEGPVIDGEAVRARLVHRVTAGASVEMYELTLTGTHQVSAPHRPGVAEALIVTDGAVLTGPADAPVELTAGDSAYFDASVTHVYRALQPAAHALLLMIYRWPHPAPAAQDR